MVFYDTCKHGQRVLAIKLAATVALDASIYLSDVVCTPLQEFGTLVPSSVSQRGCNQKGSILNLPFLSDRAILTLKPKIGKAPAGADFRSSPPSRPTGMMACMME